MVGLKRFSCLVTMRRPCPVQIMSRTAPIPTCCLRDRGSPARRWKYDYVDELPATRNFEWISPTLRPTLSRREFEIVSPLCLDEVRLSKNETQPEGRTWLGLVDSAKTRDDDGVIGEPRNCCSCHRPYPSPRKMEILYGRACSPQTRPVLLKGDAVDLEFKLVEREPHGTNNGSIRGICVPFTTIARRPGQPATSPDPCRRRHDAGEVRAKPDPSEAGSSAAIREGWIRTISFPHKMTVGK